MLDGRQMMKQMLDLNKTTLTKAWETTRLFQEQAEKVTNIMLDQTSWIPKEKKKEFGDCVSIFKDGLREWENSVNENFDTLGDFMEASMATATSVSNEAEKSSPAPIKTTKPESKKK